MNQIICEEDAHFPPAAQTGVIVDGNATFYMKDVPTPMVRWHKRSLSPCPKLRILYSALTLMLLTPLKVLKELGVVLRKGLS